MTLRPPILRCSRCVSAGCSWRNQTCSWTPHPAHTHLTQVGYTPDQHHHGSQCFTLTLTQTPSCFTPPKWVKITIASKCQSVVLLPFFYFTIGLGLPSPGAGVPDGSARTGLCECAAHSLPAYFHISTHILFLFSWGTYKQGTAYPCVCVCLCVCFSEARDLLYQAR